MFEKIEVWIFDPTIGKLTAAVIGSRWSTRSAACFGDQSSTT